MNGEGAVQRIVFVMVNARSFQPSDLDAEARHDAQGARVFATAEQRLATVAAESVFLSVELDAIADRDCRRKMQGIPTSWTLTGAQVDATLAMGEALFLDNPALAGLAAATGAAAGGPAAGAVDRVCAGLPEHW
ncbi:hypothetical protein [Zavarzinia compransoris]|uniref:Uncharacterized protein n=1 Tax=Zavarzinia compransoris TaxID=1264899 RepID=A0A317E9H2_9PROT|nr:hypothetical protein [Zavarzinia compransoris]PWR21775.1 hypothetical protein DKG75_07235 [Zavarzinia compransoris]TDP45426.1 hypothetical protein DES42_105130 [Zavarzinia compransoris]